MNSILKRRGMKMISLEKYREIFTFPVKDYYLELGFDLEKEPFEISGLEFIKAYEKRKYDARLYPEVFFLLNELSKRGISQRQRGHGSYVKT